MLQQYVLSTYEVQAQIVDLTTLPDGGGIAVILGHNPGWEAIGAINCDT
jgi:hypothetical protein